VSNTGWARNLKLYYVEPFHMEYSLVDGAEFLMAMAEKSSRGLANIWGNEKYPKFAN
jgi:hypothetical protein